MMEIEQLKEKMWMAGVIPVIAIESPELALPMADALIEGGLPVAEITFRTKAAADVIDALRKKRPDILLGAGTILSVESLEKAKECGAAFGVSPGLNPSVVEKAKEFGFPFFPGVMTPSEIELGLSYGIRVLKFFPSEASGGIKMIKAVTAPYTHLGVKLIPTGGVNKSNLEEYLLLPQILVVGGTWIAQKDLIDARQWNEIKKNAREASEIVHKVRG
jgi:2-dehydro-3-deoxyphosphogluconate aldolase/(4S)-4-hydroxy-2-oxoglutarate aldolase